jgi:hypothetical protein
MITIKDNKRMPRAAPIQAPAIVGILLVLPVSVVPPKFASGVADEDALAPREVTTTVTNPTLLLLCTMTLLPAESMVLLALFAAIFELLVEEATNDDDDGEASSGAKTVKASRKSVKLLRLVTVSVCCPLDRRDD